MVGIVSYGTYIPVYRITVVEIAGTWQKNSEEIVGSLGIREKSVPATDEDAVTIAIEASAAGLSAGKIKPDQIEALFVGSESHPYAVNPTSTIVGELLGVGHNYLAADLEFACKAGTAGMQAVAGLVASGQIKLGLAVGSDTAQGRPHDVLEYTSASAGAAYAIGNRNVIAALESYTSYSSDTPDFWRRDGIRYPTHAGRFTGEPAYFAHVMGAARILFDRIKLSPDKIDYCVFHMPNGKFPRDVAGRLGFVQGQLNPSLTVDRIGNPYSASSMLGLAAVFDEAKPGQTVFMVSYGSGAGSDAFFWRITDKIIPVQQAREAAGLTVKDQIGKRREIGYVRYLKQTHRI
jgi:hydroxymethylglutaryl-CoA synthase